MYPRVWKSPYTAVTHCRAFNFRLALWNFVYFRHEPPTAAATQPKIISEIVLSISRGHLIFGRGKQGRGKGGSLITVNCPMKGIYLMHFAAGELIY